MSATHEGSSGVRRNIVEYHPIDIGNGLFMFERKIIQIEIGEPTPPTRQQPAPDQNTSKGAEHPEPIATEP